MSGQDDGEGEILSSRQAMILDLPPSCIEFCPAHPSYFLVGTYNLQKDEEQQQQQDERLDDEENENESSGAKTKQPQSRNGSIVVFQLRDDGKVYPIQTMPQPSAVFDLHFKPRDKRQGAADVCATVSSTGSISLFRLAPATTADQEVLTQLSILRMPNLGEDTLFTFFAWHPTIPGLMAINTAAGAVVLVQVHEDYQGLDVWDEALLEHDGLEAWCVAFSQPQVPSTLKELQSSPSTFTIFSGGDDSKLRYILYDTAAAPTSKDDDEEEDSSNRVPYPPVSLGNHEAGVTFILPLPISTNDGSYLVATGSYDEYLRVWKIAPLDQTGGLRRANLLAEKRLGGGVWRLNALHVKTNGITASEKGWEVLVLASCMHAGSRIVRIRGENSAEDGNVGEVKIEALARFEEHKSMNYGSDWFRGEAASGGQGERLCVSTSFYDRLLCVWTFKDESLENVTASQT